MPFNPGDFHTVMNAVSKLVDEAHVIAGREAERFFARGFTLQAWQGDSGNEAWKVKHPNKSGVIMQGSGPNVRLRNSIKKTVSTRNYVRIEVTGTAAKYADVHNFGGDTQIRVTEKMKRWAWALWYQTHAPMYKAIALTPVGKVMTIHVPKTQFIGNSKQVDDKITGAFEKEFNKIVKNT